MNSPQRKIRNPMGLLVKLLASSFTSWWRHQNSCGHSTSAVLAIKPKAGSFSWSEGEDRKREDQRSICNFLNPLFGGAAPNPYRLAAPNPYRYNRWSHLSVFSLKQLCHANRIADRKAKVRGQKVSQTDMLCPLSCDDWCLVESFILFGDGFRFLRPSPMGVMPSIYLTKNMHFSNRNSAFHCQWILGSG